MKMNSEAGKAPKSVTTFLRTVGIEIVVPLIILKLYRIKFLTIYLNLLLPAVIPVIIALLSRAKSFKKRALDLYIISLIYLAVLSFAFWLPSIVFVIGFCVLFYVFIVLKKIERAKTFFLAVGSAMSLLVLLSGTFPIGGKLLLLSMFIALLNLTGMSVYVLTNKRETILARPNIALTIFTLSVFSYSFLIYITGGRTGWLTGFVAKQKGVELVFAPNKYFLMPRAVVPIKNGVIAYANIDEISVIYDNCLETTWLLGPGITVIQSFICDPDDEAICYIPTRKTGIRAVNVFTKRLTKMVFRTAEYAHIFADKSFHYIVVLEDIGAPHYRGNVAITKRVAPGKLEMVDELTLHLKFPNIRTVYFLDFAGQKLLLIAKSENKIIGLTYDIERKSLHKFMESEDIKINRIWSAALAEETFIILPSDDGKLYTLDMTGKKIDERYILPLLRYVIYDPQRKLCYVVSDIGFLIIFDPHQARTVKKIFLGLKTKSVHQRGDYLYIGSTAGIFRINIDEAIF